MFFNLKNNKIKETSFLIYKKIVSHSRNKIFYTDFKVPDTIDGRFDLIVLHLFFIHSVLFRKETRKNDIYNHLLDIMYKDFDSNLREIGVGDLSVGKKIYQMSEAVAGRINAYNNSKDNKELIYKTLSRNIYGLKKNIDKKTKSIMVQYFLINLKNIKSKNLSDIKENSDIFFDLEEFINIYKRELYGST